MKINSVLRKLVRSSSRKTQDGTHWDELKLCVLSYININNCLQQMCYYNVQNAI